MSLFIASPSRTVLARKVFRKPNNPCEKDGIHHLTKFDFKLPAEIVLVRMGLGEPPLVSCADLCVIPLFLIPGGVLDTSVGGSFTDVRLFCGLS